MFALLSIFHREYNRYNLNALRKKLTVNKNRVPKTKNDVSIE